MLMMRTVLATVRYRFAQICSVEVSKLKLRRDFEAEVWSKCKTFVQTLNTRFGQDFEVKAHARLDAGVSSVF